LSWNGMEPFFKKILQPFFENGKSISERLICPR
jgi:hypothetical protein